MAPKGLADDGKRFQAVDVLYTLLLAEKSIGGGVRGGGGPKIPPEGRLADSSWTLEMIKNSSVFKVFRCSGVF